MMRRSDYWVGHACFVWLLASEKVGVSPCLCADLVRNCNSAQTFFMQTWRFFKDGVRTWRARPCSWDDGPLVACPHLRRSALVLNGVSGPDSKEQQPRMICVTCIPAGFLLKAESSPQRQ